MQEIASGKTTVHSPFSGVVRRLADVPDAAFSEGMLGEGIAIDPLGDVVLAPFNGTVTALAPTGHSVTLRSHAGVELLIHIGIDTVRLNHQGFSALVSEGQDVTVGTPLIRFDLDYVAIHAKDCVTPIIVLSEGISVADCSEVGPIRAGDKLFVVELAPDACAGMELLDNTTAHVTTTVALPHGIHARPAAKISRFARSQKAKLSLSSGDRSADASSTTDLMKLGVACGDELSIRVVGAEARQVALNLVSLLVEMAQAEAENDVPAASQAGRSARERALSQSERRGVRAAPGLAVGPAVRLLAIDADLPERFGGFDAERDALTSGIAAVRAEIAETMERGTPVARQIAEAHLAVVEDGALLSEASRLIGEGCNAPAAWRMASRKQELDLAATGNDRLRERAIDFRDVERRLIAAILPETDRGSESQFAAGSILLCEDIQPSLLMERGASNIAAICCAGGGATSHAAILAAAAGIPMIVSLGADILAVDNGTVVAVDADNAIIDLTPTNEVLAQFNAWMEEATAAQSRASAAASQDCRLADGMRIEVFANLASAEDAQQAVRNGAEGCGLLRTEFLFSERSDAPSEQDQAEALGAIAEALDGRPLIVRTLDVGGDKPLPYFPFAEEENPALGMRGVRFTTLHPDVLRTQFRAMLSAVPPAALRIMVPMVVDVEEIGLVRKILNEVKRDLGFDFDIPLGIMVETPAAALLSEQLAKAADFFSIGSNDLSQYVLAMDRGNSGLAARIDACHPAVLQAIAQTANGAAQHKRWMGICGGLASEPDAAPLLVGLGCIELSAVPRAIPAIKEVLRRWSLAECRALAQEALNKISAAEVRQLLVGAKK